MAKKPSDEQILACPWDELLENIFDLMDNLMIRPDLLSKKLNDPADPISGENLEYLIGNMFDQMSYGHDTYTQNKTVWETSMVLAIEHAKHIDLTSGGIITSAFQGDVGDIPEYLVKFTLDTLSLKTVTSDNPLENGRRVIDSEDNVGDTPLYMAILGQQSSRSVQLLLEYDVDVLSQHPFSLMAECIEQNHSPERLKNELQLVATWLPNLHFALAAASLNCSGGQCLPVSAIVDMVRQAQQKRNNGFDNLIDKKHIAPIQELSKMMDLFSESRAVKSACEILRKSGKDPLLELEMQLAKTTAQLNAWHKAGLQAMGAFFVEDIGKGGSSVTLFTNAGVADIVSKSKVIHEMVGRGRGAFRELGVKIHNFRKQNVFVPSKIAPRILAL